MTDIRKTCQKLFWGATKYVIVPTVLKMTHAEIETKLTPNEPFIVISNHSTNYDPYYIAGVFPNIPISFVATEFMFRLGLFSKAMVYVAEPIPRKKASSGADTVKACLRAARAGKNIGLLAEGETTWNGISIPVPSATGKLVKSAGVSLVTLRIEGGYLTKPRWAKHKRNGTIKIKVAHVYSKEDIQNMSASEILDAINRDIFYNCWEDSHGEFIGEDMAAGIEIPLYRCPVCGHIGTIKTEGNRFFCEHCKTEDEYLTDGTFRGGFGFKNIYEWDVDQKEKMRAHEFVPQGEDFLFEDAGVSLKQIASGHNETIVGRDLPLIQKEDRIVCGPCTFYMNEINNMAVTFADKLLFPYRGHYFEIRLKNGGSVKKYLDFWKNRTMEDK